ncbi:unnamed protein product [Cladocopium goreaui]|uniref:Reticulocyte-binding protein 2-like a n=1 Tax=Cladocopium goreaui TaxID=2562237 RepID=A0A9P1CYG2_9DINO|nr:unnamed protein product [Cladocopium goreaui]|mmetsp:Transcript_47013/g.102330  ORF Transcript_47013/g.102330 Transcript_47013/m.102330 type:complete len:191 (+) Transcript_47013:47-619(+)
MEDHKDEVGAVEWIALDVHDGGDSAEHAEVIGLSQTAKEAKASIDLTASQALAPVTVELDDEETVVETRPVVLSVPSVPVKPKVKKKKKKKTTTSSDSTETSSTKKKRKEVDKDAKRKLAEEAARRWQERDDKLEASIRVVEQRGAKAAAEKEAEKQRKEKERQQRYERQRLRHRKASRSRSRRRKRSRS